MADTLTAWAREWVAVASSWSQAHTARFRVRGRGGLGGVGDGAGTVLQAAETDRVVLQLTTTC